MIALQQLNEELQQLQALPAQWYWETYGTTYQVCLDSASARHLLVDVANHVLALLRAGRDCSMPLNVLAATMLQTGYAMGRRSAEAEILEGWMKL